MNFSLFKLAAVMTANKRVGTGVMTGGTKAIPPRWREHTSSSKQVSAPVAKTAPVAPVAKTPVQRTHVDPKNLNPKNSAAVSKHLVNMKRTAQSPEQKQLAKAMLHKKVQARAAQLKAKMDEYEPKSPSSLLLKQSSFINVDRQMMIKKAMLSAVHKGPIAPPANPSMNSINQMNQVSNFAGMGRQFTGPGSGNSTQMGNKVKPSGQHPYQKNMGKAGKGIIPDLKKPTMTPNIRPKMQSGVKLPAFGGISGK